MVSETKEEKNNRIAIQNNRMKIERDNLEKKQTFNGVEII